MWDRLHHVCGAVTGLVVTLSVAWAAPSVSWLWWNVSGFLIAVSVGVLSSLREAGWVAASDTVWTLAFFVDQGFERSWVLGYFTLAGAACGFLVVLGVFGVR